MRKVRFSLVCFLGLLLNTAAATSIGVELMQCPLCGEQYATSVIRSWNFNLSGGAGPPAPRDQCPYCLYAWRDEPRALAPDAKDRARTALSRTGTNLSLAVRIRIEQILSDPQSGDESALLDHFISVCDAVVHEMPAPVLRGLPKPRRQTGWSDEHVRSFKRVLPQMLAELRKGKLGTLPEDNGDREMSALYSSADLIRESDPLAAEFFIRWITSADTALIRGKDHAVGRNFASLSALPAASWPIAIPSTTRMPLMADCLRYAGSEHPAPEPIRKKLAATKWDEFSDIVIACCVGRKDRSVTSLLTNRLQKNASWREMDSAGHYFAALGVPADLDPLTRFAHRVAGRRAGEAMEIQKIEGALRLIRLRATLATASPDTSQSNK